MTGSLRATLLAVVAPTLLVIGAAPFCPDDTPAPAPVHSVNRPVEPTTPAPAEPPAEPYGGCDEAWQAPDSPGADDCRSLGWTVTDSLVVAPDGALVMSSLPACATADGTGGATPCTVGVTDGRRVAPSWIDRHGTRHTLGRS